MQWRGTEHSSAARRLLRDWKEMVASPLSTVTASPLPHNIFTWHCNIRPDEGPYKGIPLHLVLQFPHNYPAQPPTLRMPVLIPHPNVFSRDFICLDLIKPPEYGKTAPYTGWSSAYTVVSILLQLQSFLFSENIPQMDYMGGEYNKEYKASSWSIDRAKTELLGFRCDKCGHKGLEPFPPFHKLSGVAGFETVVYVAPKFDMKRFLQRFEKILTPPNEWDKAKKARGTYVTKDSNVSVRGEYWGGVIAEKGFSVPQKAWAYYEVTAGAGKGVIRCGWSATGACEFVGQDAGSWAYDSRGKKVSEGESLDYGEPFEKDDVIGCGLDLWSGQIQFWKNGNKLGPAYEVDNEYMNSTTRFFTFYPSVSVYDASAKVCWNNGIRFSPIELQKKEEEAAKEEEKEEKKEEEEEVKEEEPPKEVTPESYEGELVTCLPDELVIQIVEGLPLLDLHHFSKTCHRYSEMVSSLSLQERRNVICYHSKLPMTDAVLGVGVVVSRFRDGSLQSLSAPAADLISMEAFEEGVRMGVWGGKFTHFLPVILSPHHAVRAFECAPKYFAALLDVKPEKADLEDMVFVVIPKLMNSVVVSFMEPMNDANLTNEEKQRMFSATVSEKALLGYSMFHHMLLWYANKYPSLSVRANAAIYSFIDNPEDRHKAKCPNLGEWLVLLSLTTVAWSDVAVIFLKECFIRNVKWAIEKDASLQTELSPEVRLRKTWQATLTSMRLIMFQVYFLSLVRPKDTEWKNTLINYNRCFGIPRGYLQARLQLAVSKIFAVDSWHDFFKFIDTNEPPEEILCQQLETAINVSGKRRYHRTPPGTPAFRGALAGRGRGSSRGQEKLPVVQEKELEKTAAVRSTFAGRGLMRGGKQ